MEYTTTTDHLSLARELVEIVRLQTDASYSNARSTVDSILTLLADSVQCDRQEMGTVLKHVGGGELLDVENCSDTIRWVVFSGFLNLLQ